MEPLAWTTGFNVLIQDDTDGMKTIPVYRKNTVVAHALVDDENHETLSKYKWNRADGYAQAWLSRRDAIKMHHLVLAPVPPMVTDHINGNTLDNQRHNLRNVTRQQNGQNRKGPPKHNTSGFRGVIRKPHCPLKPWQARISCPKTKKRISLGQYATAEEAGQVVAEARKCYGYLDGAQKEGG